MAAASFGAGLGLWTQLASRAFIPFPLCSCSPPRRVPSATRFPGYIAAAFAGAFCVPAGVQAGGLPPRSPPADANQVISPSQPHQIAL